jgi:peptide-methionine (S)-S-oxide reductase
MAAALVSKEKAQKTQKKPIVTEVLPAVGFYRAEDYHQQYLEKRGLASCHLSS